MINRLFKKKDISVVLNEPERNKGELKRSLSATNLVALGIGAIVGTGIFVITGQAAAMYAGPALTISFIISALSCVMAGLCYAEFAAMIPVSSCNRPVHRRDRFVGAGLFTYGTSRNGSSAVCHTCAGKAVCLRL